MAMEEESKTENGASTAIPKDASIMNDKEVIKLQAFVRGSLTRAKVSVLVKKLIDEILRARGLLVDEGGAAGQGVGHGTGEEKVDETAKDRPLENQQDNSGGSAGADRGDNFVVEVSDIKSKFESKTQDPNAFGAERRLSPGKLNTEKFVKQEDSLKAESSNTSGPRNRVNTTLEKNATRHVVSSDELLQEQEVSEWCKFRLVYGMQVSLCYL
jgi:hypothetical protein